MKRLLPILLVAVCATACTISYRFNGASIDYNVTKTITINDFPIRAALVYPPLATTFNETLKDAYTRQTRLSLVNSGGDLVLEGEITGYNLTPQAVTEDAYASQTRLTITVRVRYTDNKKPENDLDRTFSAYRDFPSSSMLTDVQDELITQITQELADLIFNATVGNW
ncbi:MAG TPA: LptE family protein [Candidatus Caccoplasma merdavium]|nr:LptE family protein [Candidatus Caccoplasma merdavium]